MSPADLQVLSFVLLALFATAGLLWFERSSMSPRIVAVIATLIAVAVAGRVLFAAVPSVKPTTDVVLIGGYALGAGPGFVIGVLTALVSNFFFGQGPWTLWQMLAWGSAGVAGSLVARILPRPRPLPLAISCAGAGLLFAVIVNLGHALSYMGSDLSKGFTASMIQAAPFDLAHIAGNFAFCMLFGPALARTLKRLRRRAELEWPVAKPVTPAG